MPNATYLVTALGFAYLFTGCNEGTASYTVLATFSKLCMFFSAAVVDFHCDVISCELTRPCVWRGAAEDNGAAECTVMRSSCSVFQWEHDVSGLSVHPKFMCLRAFSGDRTQFIRYGCQSTGFRR